MDLQPVQDKTLPLVCDLLGVTSEQMNDVLEHKTFEDRLSDGCGSDFLTF